MTEKQLTETIRKELSLHVSSLELPKFMEQEVAKIFKLMNYYKISNIYSNKNKFIKYLSDLLEHYNKELSDVFKVDRNLSKKETKILWKLFMDKSLIDSISYYISNNIIKDFLSSIIISTVNNVNDSIIKDNLTKSLVILEKIRMKLITLITLKISEFVHNPTRANEKVHNYFLTKPINN